MRNMMQKSEPMIQQEFQSHCHHLSLEKVVERVLGKKVVEREVQFERQPLSSY
jgi:hypothetical protein